MKIRFLLITVAWMMLGADISAFAQTYTPPSRQELEQKAKTGDRFAEAMLGESYARGEWGVGLSYNYALPLLEPAAENGNPVALYNMGRIYEQGFDRWSKDPDKAKVLYERSFAGLNAGKETADPRWLTNLASLHQRGLGTPTNDVIAVELLRKAAGMGYARAQNNLGYCYQSGEGVEKNEAEAVTWCRKAAEQGDASAQWNLGNCYVNGEGVEKDEAEAVTWFRKAAEQGLAQAQRNLGICYFNGIGVEKNMAEAVKWYRKAAEQGFADAQSWLGTCYYEGGGVEKNEAEAVTWYRKAAEQGYARAQNNLGYCYQNGEGVEKNEAEAVTWYRKAAEQGYALAQNNLGICYENGTGVEKNAEEAVTWYRKAAEQGYARAQYNLGTCYENGTGVEKNEAEAVAWYRKAAEQGFAQASLLVKKLEFNMDEANARAEAQKANTLVFKSFWLGMPIDDACQVINHRFKVLVGVETDEETEQKRITWWKTEQRGILEGSHNPKKTLEIIADANGKVISFLFSKEALDVLFETKEMPQKEFLETFINAYDVPSLESQTQDIKDSFGQEHTIGWQQFYRYRSPKGYELTFFGETRSTDNVKLARSYGIIDFEDAGSMQLKKIETAKQIESKFD